MPTRTRYSSSLILSAAAALLAACAGITTDEPAGAPRAETVFAVTETNKLMRFNAGTPRHIEQRQPIRGLGARESLVGIDFRVARGVLYGLTSAGRLVTIDVATGNAKPVGNASPVSLQGARFGFDFNPVADRIRVVSDAGQNLRLHPDTGELAAADPPLTNASAGQPAPTIVGAAYSYNKSNDKLTTNYAIDLRRGWLVTQGSIEGTQPMISPNTGRIFDIGALGTGPVDDVAFDIADTDNAALAALRKNGRTRLFKIDLTTGRARLLGTVGDGEPLRGLAIAP